MADPTPVLQSIIIWVSTDGSDITGTGSQTNPYRTIEKAVEVFQAGNQIRILDGTYIPTDSIIISGVNGSIFAENPKGVIIQPAQTTLSSACVAVLNSDRFTIQGITVNQAIASSGNNIGIYAGNVSRLEINACEVSDFAVPSGAVYGFYASGYGRLENCEVDNIACAGSDVWGIKTAGVDIIDCTVTRVSGYGSCNVYGIEYDNTPTPTPGPGPSPAPLPVYFDPVVEYLFNGAGGNRFSERDTAVGFLGETYNYVKMNNGAFNGLTNISVSFWFRSSDISGRYFFSNSNAGVFNEFSIGFSNSTTIIILLKNASNSYVVGGGYNDGVWHHLVYIKNVATNKEYIYIDKIKKAEGVPDSLTALIVGPIGSIMGQEQDAYGGIFSQAQAFDGYMSHFRTYSKALSEANISAIFDADSGAGGSAPSANLEVAYMTNSLNFKSFDDGLPDDQNYLYDNSGNGRTANFIKTRFGIKNTGSAGTLSDGAARNNSVDGWVPTMDSNAGIDGGYGMIFVPSHPSFDFITINNDYIDGWLVPPCVTSSFTVTVWIKTLDLENSTIWAVNTAAGGNRFIFDSDNGGKLRLYDGGASNYTTQVVADGIYNYVAVSINADTNEGKFYINGVHQVGDDFVTAVRIQNTDRMVLGMEYDGATPTDWFNGDMDFFRLYDKVLSDSQILQLYTQRS